MEVRDVGGIWEFRGIPPCINTFSDTVLCRKNRDPDPTEVNAGVTCQEKHPSTRQQLETWVRRMDALGTSLPTSHGHEASRVTLTLLHSHHFI